MGGLNEACNDNILQVEDDSPKGKKSFFKSAGLKARCGQSEFPPPNEVGSTDGVLTVRFKSNRNSGRSRFRLRVTGGLPASCPGKVTSGCPDGPCCKGKDCCLINAGNTPKEIMSPNFPSPATAGLDCQYKMVTAPGSQIALNFLSLDIRTDSSQSCLSDSITLEDPVASPTSMLGSRKTFCGQKLPNYPGPSVLVSAGNSLVLKYQTDNSESIKGSGFKATVSAINPTCNKMTFEYQYGEEVCNSTCGVPYEPSTPFSPVIYTTTPRITSTTPSSLINDTCQEEDVVYEGNLIKVVENVPTWKECAHACWLNKDECEHFSWTQEESCSLKNEFNGKEEQAGTISGTADCGELETPEPSTTSTPVTPSTTSIPDLIPNTTACIEEGRFYDSVEGQKQIRNIKSWQTCLYLCKLDPECKGFTWAGPEYLEATVMYVCALKPELKVGTEEGGPDSKIVGAVRGKKECGEYVPTTTPTPVTTTTRPLKNDTCLIDDTHYKGTPLQSIEDITSWEHCAHICRDTTGCSFWSFFTEQFQVSTMDGQCDLQGSDEGHGEALGVISGTAKCGEWITTTPQPSTIPPIQNETCENNDEDINGTPIKIIRGIDKWEHCAYLCNQDNKCQFWTWTSERFPLDAFNGDCDLKERDGGKKKAIGIISGSSDCGQPPTVPPSSTVTSTTTPSPTETYPQAPEKCSEGVELTISISDIKTGDPTQRAIVTIRTKEVTRNERIPSLLVTRISDANGKVVEKGAIGATYNIRILYETEKFLKQFDWSIRAMDVTCVNEECTKCGESIHVRAELKEQTKDCSCQSELTVVDALTQLPIADACLSVTVQEQEESRLISSSQDDNADSTETFEDEDFSSESSESDAFEDDSYEVSDRIASDLLDRALDQSTCEKIGVYYASVAGQKVIRGVKSWHECAYYCRKMANCAGFTWTDRSFQTPSLIHMCTLKPQLVDGGVKKGVISGTRECGECMLQTDIKGKVDIITQQIGDYFLTVSHPEFAMTTFQKTIEQEIAGECDFCNLKLRINMTKDICNMEQTPVTLTVTVINNDTKEYIEDATVYLEVVGLKGQTDANGKITFPIKENGKYRFMATAPDMNTEFEGLVVRCDPNYCTECKPDLTISMVPVEDPYTIPPTEEPCNKPAKQQISLNTIDAQTKEHILDVTYSIAVNGRYVAKDYDSAGDWNWQDGLLYDIKENGLYSVIASVSGYISNSVS